MTTFDTMHLITHNNLNHHFDLSQYQQSLQEQKNLILPLEEIALLKQLVEFELGRFY
jgi:hypothetical protein